MSGICLDITDRKRNEEKNAEQAGFITRVFNSTDSHMAVVDSNGIIIGVNEAWSVGLFDSLPTTGGDLFTSLTV